MGVRVEVAFEGEQRPPAGAVLHVRALDTTYADAAAEVVAEADDVVGEGETIGTVELDVEPPTDRDVTVYAHVDVSGDGQVQPGDFVTTQSYPLRELGDSVRVVVRPV